MSIQSLYAIRWWAERRACNRGYVQWADKFQDATVWTWATGATQTVAEDKVVAAAQVERELMIELLTGENGTSSCKLEGMWVNDWLNWLERELTRERELMLELVGENVSFFSIVLLTGERELMIELLLGEHVG